MRRRARRYRWTRHPREDELPASERFADNGPSPEQVAASTELREIISENLDELSLLLRTAFVLRDVQGYSTGEAAKKLGRDGKYPEGATVARAAPACRNGWAGACGSIKADVTGGDRQGPPMMGEEACSYC